MNRLLHLRKSWVLTALGCAVVIFAASTLIGYSIRMFLIGNSEIGARAWVGGILLIYPAYQLVKQLIHKLDVAHGIEQIDEILTTNSSSEQRRS